MAVTAVADLNGLFNTIYQRAAFVAREMNLMAQLVEPQSATGWMTRNISKRPQLTAESVAETQDYSAPATFGKTSLANLTPGEVISQVVLTDRDMETDPDGAMRDAEAEMGGAVATKIDVDLLSLFSSFSKDKGAGAGATATLAKFAAAVAVLGNAHANKFGMINAVLHPYTWHDLWTELGLPAVQKPNFGDITVQVMNSYYKQELNNARVFVSANIAVDANDDAVSGMFVRPAIVLDTRRPMRLEPQRDASARAWELNMTAGYAYGVAQSTYGVAFTNDVTEPS